MTDHRLEVEQNKYTRPLWKSILAAMLFLVGLDRLAMCVVRWKP